MLFLKPLYLLHDTRNERKKDEYDDDEYVYRKNYNYEMNGIVKWMHEINGFNM